MDLETFKNNFNLLADTPKGIPKLREMILQLAVMGKLVPQDPNDEPASELLKKIAKEKERLVKEGKIKTSEPLPPVKLEEMPYELPNGWEWVRLGNITNKIGSGSTPRGGKSTYSEYGIPFFRSQNIWNHGLELADVAYITEKIHHKMANTTVLPNDILLNITGASLGRCATYPDGLGEANVSQHVTIIRPTESSTTLYLHLFIMSPHMQDLIWRRQVGMAREGLSKKVLELFEIHLPPLPEQYRIVAKVDQLMALCDELEERQKRRNTVRVSMNSACLNELTSPEPEKSRTGWNRVRDYFNLLYDTPENVAALRQSILQLAVMGKLVPQDPNDEPASVLLEKIAKEKERLTKEGKIKKSDPLPPVKQEEMPYELPEGWEWSRLGNLGFINPRNELNEDIGAAFIPMELISDKYGIAPSFEVRKWKEIKNGFTHFSDGDVGLAKITPCFQNGKSAVFQGLPNGVGAGTTELHVFRPLAKTIIPHYVWLYLKSPRFVSVGEVKMTGSAGQKRVPKEYFSTNPFSLPPLPEQQRIVAKVDQLMALCDELESRLKHSQFAGEKLMEAIAQKLAATA